MKLLISWLGKADLKAASGKSDDLGPIAAALTERDFDTVVLLNNYPKGDTTHYLPWLKKKTKAKLSQQNVTLEGGPTDFASIYRTADTTVADLLQKYGTDTSLTFHISPGTPMMATVWILLSKTKFVAELIETSTQHGLRTITIPLDISAEFASDLMRDPDSELERLSLGHTRTDAPAFDTIIGKSHALKEVKSMATRLAMYSVPVVIEGESGTGKELFSHAIHAASPRKDHPFIPINCGAIPAELVETQLFGYKKGAHSTALKDTPGAIEEADNGTLFLDEIGELPLEQQVKLLRVLQEKEVTRLGEAKPRKVNFRVIAATNRSLAAEVQAGRFREDLFYRLMIGYLLLPPLRDRKGDLGPLIDTELARLNGELMTLHSEYVPRTLSVGARGLLVQQPYPGNVRELHNILQRAIIFSSKERIAVEDINRALMNQLPKHADDLDTPIDANFDIQDLMSRVAKRHLERALTQSNGNTTKAANLLGLKSYQTFNNWAKKYSVEV